ncbi:MAG: ABC transporter ATP-binding protein, partial [Oscillospiraceae bacterium]|nr:ABC transporter ATP-binding protein [Oscillospiraceae bacterium]
MLQIQGISKVYKTGGLVQQALDGVSLNLRDSEFVAILGQSGSGKTTLLNIIGGLDRYDEGDLIINGISTKQYSDRDWDSYRNHTVGFVFQSYNLIPHQTILANVELALTIGGISRRERTRRAREALEKVGLAEHVHKRPSQLSGGQMQRVAIARALVNDPDILLADEPTGALDSDTSIQVMDLLKEVASDRLVVMVTHNPELAEQYATRVVNLRDGHILSDSDPFVPDTALAAPAVHKNMGKASMSLLTGLLLSFNNLRTKKARTILVAVAGSIGIIGIAMILSMSNGVDRYIQSVEEDTLQGYPLQITDTSFDFTSFYAQAGLTADNADGDAGDEPEQAEKDVKELRTVTNMLSRVNTNDLKSLKAYLDSDQSDIARYTRSIAYTYNISPQIYAIRGDTVRQVNPDKSFAALGFSATDNMSGMLSSFSSTDTFHAMPADESLYKTQYDVKAGHWPEAYNECVLVLTSGGLVTDLTLYTLGLKDPVKLDEMVRAFAEGGPPQADEDNGDHNYEDFLGIQFRLVPAVDYYVYDAQYKIWTDKTDDPA